MAYARTEAGNIQKEPGVSMVPKNKKMLKNKNKTEKYTVMGNPTVKQRNPDAN